MLDREAGNRLLASGKDRHEHELVTQAMKSVLGPRSQSAVATGVAAADYTPTLWHLATPIAGTALAEENAHVAGLSAAPDAGAERFPASGGRSA
ncbi:isochorismate synthase [Klebsiella pneumoniae]|uniref:Isochorismate synthase n=1 Tax=Klebsiella pneumoniae TaxID=573 RepID=A0A378F937_KLEPN|nr:isochorismate synthase [Klebsiella pneumoniae]